MLRETPTGASKRTYSMSFTPHRVLSKKKKEKCFVNEKLIEKKYILSVKHIACRDHS